MRQRSTRRLRRRQPEEVGFDFRFLQGIPYKMILRPFRHPSTCSGTDINGLVPELVEGSSTKGYRTQVKESSRIILYGIPFLHGRFNGAGGGVKCSPQLRYARRTARQSAVSSSKAKHTRA